MKKVSMFFALAVTAICHGSPLTAAASNLVCIEDRPFVKKAYFERGCSSGVEPFFSSLQLTADSVHGGTVDFKIDSNFDHADPHCDNPRGRYVVHHFPLPIYSGIWDISEEGELLGQVSFLTILPCKIKGAGPIIQ